jgi:hypothetical protein
VVIQRRGFSVAQLSEMVHWRTIMKGSDIGIGPGRVEAPKADPCGVPRRAILEIGKRHRPSARASSFRSGYR